MTPRPLGSPPYGRRVAAVWPSCVNALWATPPAVPQLALELERPDMVSAALHHGAPVKEVDLYKLYTKLTDPESSKYPLFHKHGAESLRAAVAGVSFAVGLSAAKKGRA